MLNNLELKRNMSEHQLRLLQSEFEKRKKSAGVAWLLWFFLGGIGAHKFYVGKKGSGIAMILTLGGLGFWALFSAFSINKELRQANDKIEHSILQAI